MRFLTDECLPVRTVTLLKNEGFTVFTVFDFKLSGKDDPIIFKKAVDLNLVLITVDTDFGNILVYPPKTHHGIIILKLTKTNEAKLHTLLTSFLHSTTPDIIRKSLIVIDEHKIRIRK